MNHKPSNAEIAHIKMHLISALNGVKINRYFYDESGRRSGIAQTIAVPLKYGHKTRQLHESVQINGHVRLPAIAITMDGMSLDTNRNESKNADMAGFDWTGVDGYTRYVKPVPINMSFTVNIVTTKGSDFDEIIAHYLSVFNPNIQISWKEPFTDREIISKVIWDGSVGTNFPNDVDSNEKIRYIGTMGITVEGWIFREVEKDAPLIKKINYNLGINQQLKCHFSDDDIKPADEFTINGIPIIKDFYPRCIKGGESVRLYGNNFNHLDGVYLTPVSGTNIPTSAWNPFCLSESLSSEFPEFQGYMLPEWESIDDDLLEITIPEILKDSKVDIALINRHCGITKASESLSSRECISNTYLDISK